MKRRAKQPVIGLVGGIGSGKSHVAALLADRGGCVVAADPFGHEGLRTQAIKTACVARWSDAILGPDGEIDRRKLAKIVFADAEELRFLESLQFPYIGRRIREETARQRANPACRFVVLDAAILLEAGWPVDLVLFVDCPREVRLERVKTRGWTEGNLDAREAAQLPLDEKRRRADAVVLNVGTSAEIAARVDAALATLLAK